LRSTNEGEIGVAVHPLEDQQVGLPVPDGMTLTDLGRALGDGPLGRDLEAARLAAEAAAPQPPGPEQVPVQLQRPTFRAVDELVDGLVAQAAVLAGDLQTACDLLGRPEKLQLLDDMAAQVCVADELALPAATAPGAVLGGDRVISAILSHLAELVAGDLAVDGGAVAAELGRDLLDRQLGLEQSEEGMALLQGEVSVAAFHPELLPSYCQG
jgi:hypothetical protein